MPEAVSCAVSKCNADEWALELVLGPLQLYCAAIDCAIPEEIVDSAYAAASGTDDDEPLQTTVVVPSKTKTKPSSPQTSNTSDDLDDEDLASTVRTTITKTTTNEDGNTLQVIIPIVLGPTGISTGDIVTTTLDSQTSSSALLSQPSLTPGNSTPTPVLPLPPTSTGGAQASERPYNGNGSPFENMQAGAGKWVISAPILGLGLLFTFCKSFLG